MSFRRLVRPALFLALLVLQTPAATAAGVHVALTPALSEVDPAEELTLEFTVTEADAAFNGFDAVVEYDPAMLTFLPTAPTSLQQGAIMTGACGNTFHLFAANGDSLAFTCVLLCSGLSLTGPGAVYRLKFRAGATLGETPVRLRSPRARFYDAGLFVFPVETADAVVRIGNVIGVAPTGAPGLSLRAMPNPSRAGATTLRLFADTPGAQQLIIQDARGRRVRSYEWSGEPAGARAFTWDGLDQQGRRAAAGAYQVVFRAGARQVNGRVILVH